MIRRFRTPSFKYRSILYRSIHIPPSFPSSPSLSGSSIIRHSRLSSSSFLRFPFRNFWCFLSSMSAASSSSASESGLQRLRSLLHDYKLSAYIVPTSDAHQSEYVADCDKRRVFISGFTGSAGVALVVADSSQPSLLWTDGRYWLQGSQQLSSWWRLMKAGFTDVPKIEDWLVKNLSAGSRVGVDPLTYSISQYRALQNSLNEAGIEVVAVGENLVDKVWSDRPALPSHPVFIHPLKYSGESTSSKVAKIRQRLETNHCAAFVVTALDEIAWLFNLRGSDISYNPVFFSYALITQNVCRLYVDEQKVSKEVREFLGNDVEIKSYNSFLSDIKQAKLMLPFFSSTPMAGGSLNAAHSKIWLDPAKTNWAIYSCLSADQVFEANSPITILKAVKNEAELNGMREAHRRDAAAMCNFFYWLEETLKKEPEDVTSLTEVSVSDKLEQFRAEQQEFVGLSFETIAGVGSNGAIIHYKAEPESCKRLDKGSMFLLDSGAQFRDGTTDITRTIHLGTPSAYQRRCFTRVLQGHIALADAVFPAGTVGPMVDAFARQYLWKDGLDYVHGTGHGVGAFLNVHEGPHGIGATVRSAAMLNTPLQTGMTVSNEPGYYEENQFGIRIESIIIVKNVETPFRVANKQFLGFETITLVPIQRKLIDVTLLSPTEIQWINAYHQKCRESITPLVKGPVVEWLYENTQPIVV